MRKQIFEKEHIPMNLRLFGHDAGENGNSGSAGGDDQAGDKPGEDGEDADDAGDEAEGSEQGEKKYSEKDMEAAVQRRLAREKRKWQREQQKKDQGDQKGPGGKTLDESAGKNPEGESEADKKARKAEERAEALEMKWTCLEHDVKKDCVDDVLALAKVHMAKDDSLDIEDAIDAVLKKYPQFKDGYDSDNSGEEPDKKGWGQRHGKPQGKASTVEDEIRKQMFGK